MSHDAMLRALLAQVPFSAAPLLSFHLPRSALHGCSMGELTALGHWRTSDSALQPSSVTLTQRWSQAVVTVQKHRDATMTDIARAYAALEADGQLYIMGGNDAGIKSWQKKMQHLGFSVTVLANKMKGRLFSLTKQVDINVPCPEVAWMAQTETGLAEDLRMSCGTFGAGRLDDGTALLVQSLPDLPVSPTSVFDVACGCGVLAAVAKQHFPHAAVQAFDADARSIADVMWNSARLGYDISAQWWDAIHESLPGTADLVLCNPPWHEHSTVAIDLGQRVVERCCAAVAAGGRALIVANRRLPYEGILARYGSYETLREAQSFKLLALRVPA